MPLPFPEDIKYISIEVLNVVGSNVTSLVTVTYLNGSEYSATDWIDVGTGQVSYGSSSIGFLVAANLTAGDKTYLNDYAPTLNFSDTGMYASAERDVNHLVSIQNYSYQNQSTSMFYEFVWDSLSGIFVAVNENITVVRGGYVTQMWFKLLINETDIWAPTFSVTAEVFIVPKVVNAKSQGGWLMAVLKPPEDVKAKDVDLSTIRINGTVSSTGKAMVIGKRWLLVKFDRSEVIQFIEDNVNMRMRCFTVVTLTITAQLRNGSTLQGNDKIIIIAPPSNHSRLCPD